MVYTNREMQDAYSEYFANGGTIKKIPQGQVTDPEVLAAMLRPKRGRKKKPQLLKKLLPKKAKCVIVYIVRNERSSLCIS